MRQQIYRTLGYGFFALGALGAAVPLLPTVAPWIVAVWFLWKGNDPLAHRLLNHPQAGAHLRAWFERGEISRQGKIAASLGMGASLALTALFTHSMILLAGLALLLGGILIWLWQRPSHH
ncbi:MAG: YbaN family protein [Pseudomonadota bacterium]